MPDIFISYSRKDSTQALELAERLRATGMEVWIDQHGIEAATSWSNEIVQALDSSRAMLVLLSSASIESDNVLRELSLAFESKKTIIPIDLEAITLPTQFRYQLAGIQRARLSDFDAIVRSLTKLGIGQTAPTGNAQLPAPQQDPRMSLMVLPFEDLSPEGTNGWFADGIVSELIGALSHIKALRVIDQQTTSEYKKFKGRLADYAKEMRIRFFIDGTVRKFGDHIKISVSLLDFREGGYLWQDSHRGEFKDIFDIQEKVAERVVNGLKLHITTEEKKKINERGTNNAEAYELSIRAKEFTHRQTKEGEEFAVQLLSEAIKLDPTYSSAYIWKAASLISLYRLYRREPKLLEEAESLVRTALTLSPAPLKAYNPLTKIYHLQGRLAEAEETAVEYVRKAPEDYFSHSGLGFFYMETGQPEKAIVPYETSVRLNPTYTTGLWNLVKVCSEVGDKERTRHWATTALPLYEAHLKLHPDDERGQVEHAILLFHAGNIDRARSAVLALEKVRDGISLYNTACLWALIGEPGRGLQTLRHAMEIGFEQVAYLRDYLERDAATLRGTSQYEEVREAVEVIARGVGKPLASTESGQ
jgi:TolB-like protein